MKKHFRILAVVLTLCLTLLSTPLASAGSGADDFCQQKDGRNGLGADPWRQKVSQQIQLQQHERPGKGHIVGS